MGWDERTVALLGEEAAEKLRTSRVAVFGLGGVGSYTAEALVRAGVGSLTLVDGDIIQPSNINRQLLALHSTVGMKKAEAAAKRAADINPDAEITAVGTFYTRDNADSIDFSCFDYVADCIDMVSSKLIIAEKCRDAGVRLISSCGTGNKLNPALFEVTDIFSTSGDPLARVMRRELRKRGIEQYRVVFSPETPRQAAEGVIASISFVPSSAGLVLAGQIIRDLAGV